MRWLKFIVILLGLLIVGGAALIGYGFFKKSTQPDWRLFGNSAPPSATSPVISEKFAPRGPLPVFGDVTLAMAPGCFIDSVLPRGRRLYLTLGPKESCRRIIVVDVTNGRILGTVSAAP